MATIQENLEKIKTAVYGEEVRGAIHDSIEQMNGIVINSESKVEQYGTQINEAVKKANTATTSANDAAKKANDAATSATTATTNADNAAEKANRAASDANAAASSASTATTNANNAAGKANIAASDANTAASTAQSSAANADLATNNANKAADNANAAGALAATAADEANSAKNAANDAASKANTAATSANDAASKANTAASTVNDAVKKATDAATSANSAAEFAREQATTASTAASSASTAAKNANDAASSATTAAENVNDAVKKATDAAEKANTAATSANEAAEKANTATNSANRATTNANTAASAANKAAFDAIMATNDAKLAGDRASGAADDAMLATDKANEAASSATTAASSANTAADRANAAAKAAEDIVDDKNVATRDYVNEQIDAIEIGARNLLPNTRLFQPLDVENGTIEPTLYRGLSVRHVTANDVPIDLAQWNRLYPEKLGQQFVFSFYAKGTGTLSTYFYGPSGFVQCARNVSSEGVENDYKDGSIIFHLSSEWKRYWVKYTLKNEGDISVEKYLLIRADPNSSIYVCGAKLEKGNEPTDWSPAPEDLDANIGGTNIYIGTKDYTGNSWEYLNQWTHETEKYKGMSVISKNTKWGGVYQKLTAVVGEEYTFSCYAKCNKQSTVGIGYDNVLEGRFYASPITNSFQIGTEWKRISQTFEIKNNGTSGFKIELRNESENDTKLYVCGIKVERGNKPTDWSPAPEDLDAKIDGIEIGGVNLLPYSKEFITSYSNAVRENDRYYDFAVLHADTTDSNAQIEIVGWDKIFPQRLGQQYTFSFYAKGTGTLTCYFYRGVDIAKSEDPQNGVTIGNTDGRVDVTLSNIWKRYWIVYTLSGEGDISESKELLLRIRKDQPTSVYICAPKLETGNKATDWSPAPEDSDRAISRRTTVTHDYGGANLEEVFDGSFEKLHEALAAEDYTNIHVGDYWPITINGTFADYGSYTVPPHTELYNNKDLSSFAAVVSANKNQAGTYISEKAVSVHDETSNGTFYVKIEDCLPYFERTMTNVAVKLEVAGINHYWRYGDSGELTGNKPHIVFISRDCLPFFMRMRKGANKWEDESATNPWLGSALYRTLNEIGSVQSLYTILMNVQDKHENILGSYIYGGPNFLGMRAVLEKKAPGAANATGWVWCDRGKLFLPSSTEVWGHPFMAEPNQEGGLGNQFAIFGGSRRHISKGYGDMGSKSDWWLCSSANGTTNSFVRILGNGYVGTNNAAGTYTVPVCFIFAKEAL